MSQIETKNTINRRNKVLKAEQEAAIASKEAESQPAEKPSEEKTEKVTSTEETPE
jgi:hypothetical protein